MDVMPGKKKLVDCFHSGVVPSICYGLWMTGSAFRELCIPTKSVLRAKVSVVEENQRQGMCTFKIPESQIPNITTEREQNWLKENESQNWLGSSCFNMFIFFFRTQLVPSVSSNVPSAHRPAFKYVVEHE